MANVDPPAISTPSRPRYSLNPKRSGTFTKDPNAPNVAGFSPGGQVFEGYSYLSRSTSMSTSTRSRPKGLQSRTSDIHMTPPAASRNLPSSPSSPVIPRVAASPASSPFSAAVELPQRSKTLSHRLPSSVSTPELHSISISHPQRSESESERLAEAVANLPHNPKTWLPSQVALYLTHVLGLVPRPVVEDVTAYVRSSRMGGRAFLRLSEKDLERQGLNLKWRKLMIEAVRKLRRDALRGRIWGYESGSLRWPKSAQDLEREEAEDEDLSQEDDHHQDGIIRSTKTTSKLTLKRMRDSRKVRGMIQAFQTSPEKQDMPVSSLSMDAIYGEGYVRGQAQQILSEAEHKQLSLRRPLRPRRSTADFPWLESSAEPKKEDIEALLASLTEQEATELANELGIADLQDTDAVGRALQSSHEDSKDEYKQRRDGSGSGSGDLAEEVMQMPTLTRHGSADSTSVEGESSVSECSGTESDFAEDAEPNTQKPRYGVLDEDVIRAIMAGEDFAGEEGDGRVESDSPKSQLTRSHTTASILRPGRPYRASLYTDDELAALDTDGFHTRTESSRELVELSTAGQDDQPGSVEPDFGTARLRSAEEKAQNVSPPIPSFEASPRSQQPIPLAATGQQDAEYVFQPPSPSRTNSVRRPAGRKATFGSKRGKAVLSLLHSDSPHNELFASLPGATMLRQKSNSATAAEDEEGWGGTLGRSSSRKSLSNVFDSSAFQLPRRGLDRVASEAEGEAFHAQMDALEKEEVEAPADRYEETVLSEAEGEGGLERRASVEQRLSKLFKEGTAVPDSPAPEEEAVISTEDSSASAVVPAADEATDEAEAVADVEAVVTETISADSEAAPDSIADPELTTVSDLAPEEDAATAEPAESTAEQSEDALVATVPETQDEASADIAAASEPAQETQAETAADLAAQPDPTPADVPPALASSRQPSEDEEEPFEIISAPTLIEPEPSTDATPAHEAVDATTTAETTPSSQLLVPLTVLEPHPSGTGSIKKRSMVLVDRKRFESLARRMTDLEAQLESIDRQGSSVYAHSRGPSGAASTSGLRDMFTPAAPADTANVDVEGEAAILEDLLAATQLPLPSSRSVDQMEVEDAPNCSVSSKTAAGTGWRALLSPSSWASYLSSLNPYYSEPPPARKADEEVEEEDLSLYALLGRAESEHERHLLSIGAIPAYMLGLGAGVGFVLVREVLAKTIHR